MPVRATENNIAKDSLMDENESDSDGGTKKIKEEAKDSNQVEEPQYRPGPKSKTKMSKTKVDTLSSSESLMLTADKMMNKELTLLHAPIVMKEEAKEVTPKEPSPKDETKPKKVFISYYKGAFTFVSCLQVCHFIKSRKHRHWSNQQKSLEDFTKDHTYNKLLYVVSRF